MNLRLSELNETLAKEICHWKYDGEYTIYNYPQWDKICTDKWAITIEEKRSKEFYAIINQANDLCGYIRLQSRLELSYTNNSIY